jgi:acyl-CoA synthetase (AMP-forming)/AMP-acid ligase II
VPPRLIEDLHAVIAEGGDVETPYGATEALPVASIRGREVVGETAALSRDGAGTCVGRPVPGNDVRVIEVDDGPIARWEDARVVADGEVGEICVRGPVVTREYHNLSEPTRLAKIQDADGSVWHRMGDLARLDEQGRLWFCGRKAERVETADGPLYTDQVESRFLTHPKVTRCALVGVGPRGEERPVLVVEAKREDPELGAELLALGGVTRVLFHPRFPVDVRHNAKIHRHTLKAWAEQQLGRA